MRPTSNRRWAEGCSNAALLWRKVTGLGFTSAYPTVWGVSEATQKGGGQDRRWRGATPHDGPTAITAKVAKLVTSEPDAVPEADRGFLPRLLADAPALGDAAAIAKRLGRLLRREGGHSLDRILADAVGTPLADSAAGLGRDHDRAAVQAALDNPLDRDCSGARACGWVWYGRRGRIFSSTAGHACESRAA